MAKLTNRPPTVFISEISPLVEGGRYSTKRVVDEMLVVTADVLKEGHDQVLAALLWRKAGARKWNELPMRHLDNDRWIAELSFAQTGQYEVAILAWADDFLTWIHDFKRRLGGDQEDVSTEIEEGRVILNTAAIRAATGKGIADAEAIEDLTTKLMKSEAKEVPTLIDRP